MEFSWSAQQMAPSKAGGRRRGPFVVAAPTCRSPKAGRPEGNLFPRTQAPTNVGVFAFWSGVNSFTKAEKCKNLSAEGAGAIGYRVLKEQILRSKEARNN